MIDNAQRSAARLAAVMYLLTDATAIFGNTYVSSKLYVASDLARTATNIANSEWLYRLGIAADLFTFAGVIVVAISLYVVLQPINSTVALLALSWRLVENAVLVLAALSRLHVLGLLSEPAYQNAFQPDQVHASMMLAFDARSDAYSLGLLFAGLGSAAFAYLFLRSKYIPTVLARWGVFAGSLVVVSAFAFILFPTLRDTLDPGVYVPLLIFELGTAMWLLAKGLPRSVEVV